MTIILPDKHTTTFRIIPESPNIILTSALKQGIFNVKYIIGYSWIYQSATHFCYTLYKNPTEYELE